MISKFVSWAPLELNQIMTTRFAYCYCQLILSVMLADAFHVCSASGRMNDVIGGRSTLGQACSLIREGNAVPLHLIVHDP